MKKSDVPQDKGKLTELCYVVDEKGDYTTINSTGWEPKKIALENAIQEINERSAAAKSRVLNNETSPIEYYMELNKMDLNILASYVGLWSWRVKRHFKPKVFKNLSDKILQKYADTFEISVEQLKDVEYGS